MWLFPMVLVALTRDNQRQDRHDSGKREEVRRGRAGLRLRNPHGSWSIAFRKAVKAEREADALFRGLENNKGLRFWRS